MPPSGYAILIKQIRKRAVVATLPLATTIQGISVMDKVILRKFFSKVTKTHGCWLWQGAVTSDGYGGFYSQGKITAAHRVSWQILHGELKPFADTGICVLHKCDTPLCVNPAHLFLGTKQQNSNDMTAKRRQKSILTVEDVRFIRRDKMSTKLLAKKFGVSSTTINDARRGRWWKHV